MTERGLNVLAWPAQRKRFDNPYSYLVQASTADHGVVTTELSLKSLLSRAPSKLDVVHIHWPDILLLRGAWYQQLATGIVLLAVLRIRQLTGSAVVWTVHNLLPHEVRSPRTARWFMNRFAHLIDGVISPSASGLDLAYAAYPQLRSKPSEIVPIGSYAEEYDPAPDQTAARTTLGIAADAHVLLSFGYIRKYKNLPALIRTFRQADMGDNAVLMIAGPCSDDDELARMHAEADGDARVMIRAERIDNSEVPTLFAAADYFVAPFKNILNSSSIILALDYQCAVIAPGIGGLPEVARQVGADWVRLFDGELTPEILTKLTQSRPQSAPDMSAYQWPVLGAQTAALFRRVSRKALS